MNFLKISTSNSETRWLNIGTATRASLASDAASGERILTVVFPNDKITIRSCTPEDDRAIDALLSALNGLSHESDIEAAA